MTPEQLLFQKSPQAFNQWLADTPPSRQLTAENGMPLWLYAIENDHPMGALLVMMSTPIHWSEAHIFKNTEKEATLLSLCFSMQSIDALEACIQLGFNTNPPLAERLLPVYKPKIRTLISEKINSTLLHDVLPSLNIDMLSRLLDTYADKDLRNSLGNTALHDASVLLAQETNGTFPLIDLLLEKGLSLQALNRDGFTPKDYMRVMLDFYRPSWRNNSTLVELNARL